MAAAPSPSGGTKTGTTIALSDSAQIIKLRAHDVKPYKDNPRTDPHPDFEGLKDSIRQRGMDQMLSVTQDPITQEYVLYAGGKNRLRAAQELATENPEKFGSWSFAFREYTSDATILAAHLAENIQRGDMSFWDTATGVVQLRKKREQELNRVLSSREFESFLKTGVS